VTGDDKRPEPADVPPSASMWQVARAVFWSFFGVRRGSEHENDFARIRPIQIVIAGIVGAALMVVALIVVVRLVLS